MCKSINIGDYISQDVEHSNKGLSVKITSHIDMQGLSKAISDEINEQLLYEIATRHGYVKRNNEDYLREIYDWAYENMECCDEPEWSLFSGLYDVIGQYYRDTNKSNNSSPKKTVQHDVWFI